MPELFENEENIPRFAPLAERMRPSSLEDFFGQTEIIGDERLLRRAIENDEVPSLIFWGPPGCGKTSLARVIANITKSKFAQMSAASGGVKTAREIIEEASQRINFENKKTILFVDEIHRFSKSQQDAFLPHVERGIITLIGATTENPSFEVNPALLSRCRVFTLKSLDSKDVFNLLSRAIHDDKKGLGHLDISISDEDLNIIAEYSSGDARTALNILEFVVSSSPKENERRMVTKETISDCFKRAHLLYNKKGESHFDIISALHKSMRGSDADASLYWLGRMLEAGDDPLYIARRIIRFASEDIGLANPAALTQAIAAYNACHYLGMPECNVNLAQAVVYMAKCSKSNALYKGYMEVASDIEKYPNEPVPLHLRNAPTKLMKELNYGKGYKYNPDHEGEVDQDYLPEKLKGKRYLG